MSVCVWMSEVGGLPGVGGCLVVAVGVFVECSPLLGSYYVSTTILLNPASSTPFMCNSSCKWLHCPPHPPPMSEVGGGILLSVYHPTTLSPNSCLLTKAQIIIPSYSFTVSRAGGGGGGGRGEPHLTPRLPHLVGGLDHKTTGNTHARTRSEHEVLVVTIQTLHSSFIKKVNTCVQQKLMTGLIKPTGRTIHHKQVHMHLNGRTKLNTATNVFATFM